MQLKTSECFRAQLFPLGLVFAKTSAFWLGRILSSPSSERRRFPVRPDLSRSAVEPLLSNGGVLARPAPFRSGENDGVFARPDPFPLRRER